MMIQCSLMFVPFLEQNQIPALLSPPSFLPLLNREPADCETQNWEGKRVIDVKLERKSETSAMGASVCYEIQKFSRTHTFYIDTSVPVNLIRPLVACPTWTHGEFNLGPGRWWDLPSDGSLPGAFLDDLVCEIFPILRSCRSLASLDIFLEAPYNLMRHLPTLLCENHFLKTFNLSRRFKTKMELVKGEMRRDPDLAQAIALCFSRNSVLKSCTLVLDSDIRWEVVLMPFTTNSMSEANFGLKELVLEVLLTPYSAVDACGEALTNLVRCNTTLDKLVLQVFAQGSHVHGAWPGAWRFDKLMPYRSLAEALAVNHTLKEFGCVCNVQNLKKLLTVFVPDPSGDHANTNLTTLKLFPTYECRAEDYMKELSRMLKVKSTLKHVEIVQGEFGDIFWLLLKFFRSSKAPYPRRDDKSHRGLLSRVLLESMIHSRGLLESMIRDALRVNTSLQSLVVGGLGGSWELRREGGEWQMSYDGLCLSTEIRSAEYEVVVQMRP